MTIDERIEALTMNLELHSRDQEAFMAKMDANIVELKAATLEIKATNNSLATLITLHDRDINVLLRAATYGSVTGQDHRERMDRFEKRLDDLEGKK